MEDVILRIPIGTDISEPARLGLISSQKMLRILREPCIFTGARKYLPDRCRLGTHLDPNRASGVSTQQTDTCRKQYAETGRQLAFTLATTRRSQSQNTYEVAEVMEYQNEKRPAIFGIYGVPGSGKTYLLDGLKQVLGSGSFIFFEGSEIIAKHVSGGLDAFKQLAEEDKTTVRGKAIRSIMGDCVADCHAGIVTGHYMFWPEGDEHGTPVCTSDDLDTYTHILYLDISADAISNRCRDDSTRSRSSSVQHLQRWQAVEKAGLRRDCYQNGILFSVLDSETVNAVHVSMLLQHFLRYSRSDNMGSARKKLDEAVEAQGQQIESMLVFDGDKTMAAEDTGSMFWQIVQQRSSLVSESDPLTAIFSSPLAYSHTAFHQATLLYESIDSATFVTVCTEVAAKITLYDDIQSLLRLVSVEEKAGAVVVTCGVRLIWQKVLERAGIADKIKVIGAGRLDDGIVVDADVKAALVSHLQQHHRSFVTAFGDSPLDLPMMSQADEAVVVVGDEESRSKSMDVDLAEWINNKGLRPRQAVLVENAAPRLDEEQLPLVQFNDLEFNDDIFPHRRDGDALQVTHLTDTAAAKILMTPMRHATNIGPGLRAAHHNTGWYLAIHVLAGDVGIATYPISHVQDNQATGYRLKDEERTLIVALMRGGEPMALGISEAFPLASFLHASQPQDISAEHIRDKRIVMLVDSVINDGHTMVDFTHRVHHLAPNLRITMVAGVVQAKAISKLQDLRDSMRHPRLSLVTLRLSDNKYTGTGLTDTGNRLFNTLQLK